MMFNCINLNHECIVVEKKLKTGQKEEQSMLLSGPSVDEVCLLNMAKSA
jgi:hypothetical protein